MKTQRQAQHDAVSSLTLIPGELLKPFVRREARDKSHPQDTQSQNEQPRPSPTELEARLAAEKVSGAHATDCLAHLRAQPLELRKSMIGEDVYSKIDRYAFIEAHALAELLGVEDSRSPVSGEWHMIAYAPIKTLEEQVSERDTYEDWINHLNGKITAERLGELEPHFAKFAEDLDEADLDFTFLRKPERCLLEKALAEEDLERNQQNGVSTVAQHEVDSPGGKLLFEGDVEDDGACITLRTPYDCRDGRAVDLKHCVTHRW
jgi:hypothetical protein